MSENALVKMGKSIYAKFTKKKREYEAMQKTVNLQVEVVESLKQYCDALKSEIVTLHQKQAMMDQDNLRMMNQNSDMESLLKEYTSLHIDLSANQRDPHQIIMLGQLKGRDYFRIFSVHKQGFEYIHRFMKEKENTHKISTIEGTESMRACVTRSSY